MALLRTCEHPVSAIMEKFYDCESKWGSRIVVNSSSSTFRMFIPHLKPVLRQLFVPHLVQFKRFHEASWLAALYPALPRAKYVRKVFHLRICQQSVSFQRHSYEVNQGLWSSSGDSLLNRGSRVWYIIDPAPHRGLSSGKSLDFFPSTKPDMLNSNFICELTVPWIRSA